VPDENTPGGGDNEPGANGADKEPEAEPVSEAETIEDLLASVADRARASFDAQVKLGQKAVQRLVDPESVTGSIADDAQAFVGLLARDAMLAVDTWTRLVYLSSRKNE